MRHIWIQHKSSWDLIWSSHESYLIEENNRLSKRIATTPPNNLRICNISVQSPHRMHILNKQFCSRFTFWEMLFPDPNILFEVIRMYTYTLIDILILYRHSLHMPMTHNYNILQLKTISKNQCNKKWSTS